VFASEISKARQQPETKNNKPEIASARQHYRPQTSNKHIAPLREQFN
jgi:hypothetical protein